MTPVEKISSQVAKVRAKIAEIERIKEDRDSAADVLTQVYATECWPALEAARDEYLALSEKLHRAEGAIKRMTRKAIDLYYGSPCEWFKFDRCEQYIRNFNETFRNWN